MNKLYELNMSTWTWKVHKTKLNGELGSEVPSPRIGASMIVANDKIYMFGGLGNQSNEDSFMIPMYRTRFQSYRQDKNLLQDKIINY